MVKTYCSSCTKRCVGDVLKVGDKHFHINCFTCKDCDATLDAGGFFFRNNNYYCLNDYTNRFSNKCFICGNIISSEIVSALNRHFHRECFKCDKCSNVFAPGNKVAMKNGKFLCSFCSFQSEIPHSIEQSKINSPNEFKSTECETNKEVLSDDNNTDQGYMSADPTSLSLPIQAEEEHSRSQTLTDPVIKNYKSRSSTARSLFDFGKFYRSSYLDIEEKQRKNHHLQSKKLTSKAGVKNVFSQNVSHLYSSKRSIKTLSHNMGSVLNKEATKTLGSASEFPVNEKENIIRLSSYPAGEKHPDNIPYPIERDDWPAPLSTAVLLQEKKKRGQKYFDNSVQSDLDQLSPNHTIDYTQSLDHLALSSKNHDKNLLEVITNNQSSTNDPVFNEDVISVSRSPNAKVEPVTKPRFTNHTNKSRSRDTSYFNDPNRHIGYSLDFVSSTNRSFMVGSVPNNMYGKLAHKTPANHVIVSLKFGYTKGMLYNQKMESSIKKPIFGECSSTIDNNININNNCKNNKHILHSVSNTAYSWTANRTMSDTFDVQLKNSEYDLIFDEMGSENVDALSSSDIDIVTGLKITRNKYSKDRIKDPTLTSCRSSINSRIESIETWSFWSHKPGDGTKPPVIPYLDLISKNSKILKLLDMHKLETYLSVEEFQYFFKLSRFEFYKLPEWKQNDLKRRVNLF